MDRILIAFASAFGAVGFSPWAFAAWWKPRQLLTREDWTKKQILRHLHSFLTGYGQPPGILALTTVSREAFGGLPSDLDDRVHALKMCTGGKLSRQLVQAANTFGCIGFKGSPCQRLRKQKYATNSKLRFLLVRT